ncbi:MAG: isocitrate lyase/phosphoenolpyruvate mutase family protein [Anaerolineae bacterium]|nr:isocitrate lyase/phosphoenolpyruvate mutase family protein [Gemmatimonadaceae bacterium]
MTVQSQRARLLHSLHVRGDPLILFNIWDAGSARALQDIGAKAIATGSWSVAAAHGYEDGEKLPIDAVLANASRITASVDLPVTIDLEGGYGPDPKQVQASVTKVIQAGAVGINFEDQIVGGEGLHSIENQCERIKSVRATAQQASVPIFINARTDIFLKSDPAHHDASHLEEAIRRSAAYADSGASGFFAPGLRNAQAIKRLCEASAIPVNIMVLPEAPSHRELADLGVARISYGPLPYRQMIVALKEAGRKALALS